MKIFQICNGYFDTKLYKELFDRLDIRGCINKIFVFTWNKSNLSKKNDDKKIIVTYFSKILRLFFYLKQKKVLKSLLSVETKFDYDIIHAHTLFSNGDIALKLKMKYGIPYIVAIRNTDINVFFKYFFFLRKYGLKIMENADKIIFLSPSYKKECLENYVSIEKREEIERKVAIIPNGINKFWIENSVTLKKRHKEIRLIYVGSIDKNKNVITTISACKKLLSQGYEVKFTVVGDIEIKIDELNEKFIQHIPYSPKEKIRKYFEESDIFIMPSKYETFGLVYAEALSQGLPVIYTRGQGFDGQIPDGEVGYSVRYDDVDEITEKIILIYDNYNTYSAKIKNYIHKFDWENITDNYKMIYENIINNRKKEL
ncbi:glycosyltransferase family 4 protein [Fusobacterium pseudoperiodonticum]|jgi:glycosyltransferase|uniref:glycosyltransferase family 4 protein n=1 Tax=Fusobacterium pseudoperiodonticum TaxID=2663009 RepID=UPI0030D5B641